MISGIPSRIQAARLLAALLGDRRPTAAGAGKRARLEPRDERFAAELAHGVVRHLTRIDGVIARAAGKPIDHIAPPALAAARIGVYQLLFTPSVPGYAAVSASVDLARALAPATAGFVNWLLRRVGPEALAAPRREEFADAAAWLATLHSFPPWLVRRWLKRFGEAETARLLEAMNVHPPPHVRVNPLRSTPEAARGALAADGFEATPGRFAPACLHVRGSGALTATALFTAGALYFQDESSQLAALALAPRPGERILDACAGVGGKTTQLAELAGNAATIHALDQDERRLALLAENAARLGAAGIEVRRGDLLDPAALPGERFDAVLLDAPCSALGTIPRHPEVKWTKRAADPKRLAAMQLRLLERAAALVAPGGGSSTARARRSRRRAREWSPPSWGRTLVFGRRPRRCSAGAIANVAELRTPEGYLRSWPHRHGIGGAFVASAGGER